MSLWSHQCKTWLFHEMNWFQSSGTKFVCKFVAASAQVTTFIFFIFWQQKSGPLTYKLAILSVCLDPRRSMSVKSKSKWLLAQVVPKENYNTFPGSQNPLMTHAQKWSSVITLFMPDLWWALFQPWCNKCWWDGSGGLAFGGAQKEQT